MTSREAFNNIILRINNSSLFSTVNRKTYDESWEVISKGVDILEIIKNHPHIDLRDLEDYWIDSDYDAYYDDYHGTTNELTYEEFEKLGEYLYGDNI